MKRTRETCDGILFEIERATFEAKNLSGDKNDATYYGLYFRPPLRLTNSTHKLTIQHDGRDLCAPLSLVPTKEPAEVVEFNFRKYAVYETHQLQINDVGDILALYIQLENTGKAIVPNIDMGLLWFKVAFPGQFKCGVSFFPPDFDGTTNKYYLTKGAAKNANVVYV